MKLDRLKILNSFKDKKFKYGGYATLLTAFVLAILIIVNLVVGQIPFKIDLTENRLFSLSDQTDTILKNLDQEIQIIGLYRPAARIRYLTRYCKSIGENKNITITYVDPVTPPFPASIPRTAPLSEMVAIS